MAEMDNLVIIVVKKIMKGANRLTRNGGVKTITSRHIQGGVRLAFSNGLMKRAVSEATKAVTKYNSATHDGHHGMRKRVLAGLEFPIARTGRLIRSLSTVPRLGQSAPIYLAAVLEYICAEILELAGNSTRDAKRLRIIPRHIMLAIKNDHELNKLFSDTVLSGGVIHNIRQEILPVSTQTPATFFY